MCLLFSFAAEFVGRKSGEFEINRLKKKGFSA